MKFVFFGLILALFCVSFSKCDEEVIEKVEENEDEMVDENVLFEVPEPEGQYWFFDNFQEGFDKWTISEYKNDDGNNKYSSEVKLSPAVGSVVAFQEDLGVLLPKAGRFYGLTAEIKPAVDNEGKDLVIQYELKFEKDLECGGAYLKLPFKKSMGDLKDFNDKTPYAIMFGPDKCGTTNKVHFIFRYQNPVSKDWEEKHLVSPPTVINDKFTHLYTLIIKSDNTYEIMIDMESKQKGSLFEDFEPSVIPQKIIDDPEDVKPEDWVDEAEIDDPEAVKPDDWDEDAPEFIDDPDDEKPEGWQDDAPLKIPDPEAEMPEEWDEEEDGDWEAPLVDNPVCVEIGCGEWAPKQIRNPEYKGIWYPPKIENPEYKGEWAPNQIENPNYFTTENAYIFEEIGGVAIDVWEMTDNILFDNILICDDADTAMNFAKSSWEVKNKREKEVAPKEDLKSMDSGVSFLDQAKEMLEIVPMPVLIGVGCLALLTPFLLCCCKRSTEEDEEDESDEEEGEIEKKEGDSKKKEEKPKEIEVVEDKKKEKKEDLKKRNKKKKKKSKTIDV